MTATLAAYGAVYFAIGLLMAWWFYSTEDNRRDFGGLLPEVILVCTIAWPVLLAGLVERIIREW
jgi:hypothetical protein